MISGKKNKVLLGSGLLLAVTSSLCCIVPILAIVSGTGSAISTFSWVSPLRPYLLAATTLVLGFAFYRAYSAQPKDECGCEDKKGVLQSKTFLWVMTGISILLSGFPYYAKIFQPKSSRQIVINGSPNVQQTILHIQGMSCEACEGHVNSALQKKKGVQEVITSYAKGISVIKFDSTVISLQQLRIAIEDETGYKIIP